MCFIFFSLSNIKINFSFLYTPKQIFSPLLRFYICFFCLFHIYTCCECSYHPLFFSVPSQPPRISRKNFFCSMLNYCFILFSLIFFLTCKKSSVRFYVLLQATIFIIPLCYTVNNPMLNAFLFFSSFNPFAQSSLSNNSFSPFLCFVPPSQQQLTGEKMHFKLAAFVKNVLQHASHLSRVFLYQCSMFMPKKLL